MEWWLSFVELFNSSVVNVYSDYPDAFRCHDRRGAEANVAEADERDRIGPASHTRVELQGAYIVEIDAASRNQLIVVC